MAINAQIGSISYNIPQQGARGWGVDVTTLLVRLAAISNQVVTANYVITTDTFFSDTSGTFGLKSNFLKGVGAIASSDGFIRMASPYANPGQGLSFPSGTPEGKSYTYLSWRNSTNSADLHLYPNNDNVTLQFAGKAQVNVDTAQTISNKIFDASNQVNAAALADGSIVDAKISTTAAIQLSKLAAVAVNRLLVSDTSGFVSPSSVTSTEAGYLAGVTSAIQTQINTKLTTNTVVTNFRDFAAGIPAGFYTSNSVGLWSARSMTSGSSKLSITDGGGVAGNPTFDVVEANLSINNIGGQLNATKIADGSVSNTSFQYLAGATSSLQTQINAKLTSNPRIASLAANTTVGYIAYAGADTYLAFTAAEVRDAVSPLTTKGDIWVRNASTNTRQPVGTNGYILVADSAQPTGLNWVPNSGGTFTASSTDTLTNKSISGSANTLTNIPLGSAVTGILGVTNGGTAASTAATAYNNLSEGVAGTPTKGDMFARNTAGMARVPVGADGFVLTADTASTSGVKWAAASAGSGSGEKNYIGNPNNSTNWTASSAAVTVATETNATLLPDNSTQTTGLRVTRVSGTTDYVRYRFTLDKADYNKKLKIQKDIAYAGTAGDYTVQVFSNTLANYTGTSTQLVVSPTGALPGNTTGQVQMSFDSSGSTAPYIEVRIVAVAGTTPIYFNNFLVGPGVIGQVPAVGAAVSYTPIYTGFGSVVTTSVEYRRVGDKLHISGRFLIGTSTGVAANMTLPPNLTVGTWSGQSLNPVVVGKWDTDNANAASNKQGTVIASTGNQSVFFARDAIADSTSPLSPQLGTAIGSGMLLSFAGELVIPIAEWSGSGTLNSGAGAQPSYAYNSSTSTASDTTTFAYGELGALVQAFAPAATAGVQKRVRSPYPNPKFAVLQIDRLGNGGWTPAGETPVGFATNDAGTTFYGVYIQKVNGTTTDYDVYFSSQAFAGDTWATEQANGMRWRVVFADTPAAVGFGLATATDSGLIKSYEEGTFTPSLATNSGAQIQASGIRNGRYTKIGRQVQFSCDVVPGSTASLSAGNLTITGLPFTAAAGVSFSCTASQLTAVAYPTNGVFYAVVAAGNNQVSLAFSYTTGAAPTAATLAQISSGFAITISGTYNV